MNICEEQLANRLFYELKLNSNSTYYVAYSGGLDSTVLLHAMVALQKSHGFSLIALHVNHNLHPDAKKWAAHCEQNCNTLDIDCRHVVLELENRSESTAREARYQWFKQQMQGSGVLLTAHHQQDRVETVLFNLMRGAGSAGLSSLRAVRPFHGAKLVRPLLICSQNDIQQYASQNRLDWLEDPSNQELVYSRNQIRHKILPVIQEFRPDALQNIARAAINLEQENSLLREIAITDLVEVGELPKHPLDNSHALCFEDLQYLSRARQANLVRFWLASLQLHVPTKRFLDELLETFKNPPLGTAILQEKGCQFRFYRGFMYVMPVLEEKQNFPTIDWRNIDQPIDLYKNKIRIDATEKLRELYNSQQYGRLRLAARPQVANPKALQGHTLNLKKWLQEMGIPPWRRQALPLLTMRDSNRDLVLGPVDQQLHSDWVSLECPVA